MEIKTFRPKWLRRASQRLCGYESDLLIAERTAKSGRRTFALGYDAGGRQFPVWIVADVPLYVIREYVRDALRGARLLKRLGKPLWEIEIDEAAFVGESVRMAEMEAYPEESLSHILP